jgi:uncharacterized membrane protein
MTKCDSLPITQKSIKNKFILGDKRNFILLSLWIIIGGFLRFHELTSKSPWTDEFATLVFSLGNNFTSIPLNQIISSETLLQPLQINPSANVSDVVNLLLNEDNHPPLYFVLLHLWLNLFSSSGEIVNLWAGRALPVFFGILAIPAFYFVTKNIFCSSLIAHLSALLIAVSPYSIFLSQEARHYTCAVFIVILSLGCFLKAAQYLASRKKLPSSLIFSWIIINGIGLSVHFFFGLAFLAEVMSLSILYLSQLRKDNDKNKSLKHWYSFLWVILGTGTTIFAWLIIISQREYGNGMTQWIQQDNSNIIRFVSPIFQLAAAWVTMICLLPIESPNLAIAVLSGLGMVIYLVWYIPIIKCGLLQGWKIEKFSLETRMLVYCFMSLVMLYLGITYFGGKDITRGARYSFVYLPVITFLLTIILSVCWERKEAKFNADFALKNILYMVKNNGKVIACVVGLMGILSSLSIAHNLGYRKYYNPTQFLDILQANSKVPSLIATTQQSLVQTGEMMGLAWELEQNKTIATSSKPNFLLIHQSQENSPETTEKLKAIIQKQKQNVDVWTVNFHAKIDLPHCSIDQQSFPGVNGYDYQLYHCQVLL